MEAYEPTATDATANRRREPKIQAQLDLIGPNGLPLAVLAPRHIRPGRRRTMMRTHKSRGGFTMFWDDALQHVLNPFSGVEPKWVARHDHIFAAMFWLYAMSKRDDELFTPKELGERVRNVGRDASRRAVRYLELKRVVRWRKVRGWAGAFDGWELCFFDVPQLVDAIERQPSLFGPCEWRAPDDDVANQLFGEFDSMPTRAWNSGPGEPETSDVPPETQSAPHQLSQNSSTTTTTRTTLAGEDAAAVAAEGAELLETSQADLERELDGLGIEDPARGKIVEASRSRRVFPYQLRTLYLKAKTFRKGSPTGYVVNRALDGVASIAAVDPTELCRHANAQHVASIAGHEVIGHVSYAAECIVIRDGDDPIEIPMNQVHAGCIRMRTLSEAKQTCNSATKPGEFPTDMPSGVNGDTRSCARTSASGAGRPEPIAKPDDDQVALAMLKEIWPALATATPKFGRLSVDLCWWGNPDVQRELRRASHA